MILWCDVETTGLEPQTHYLLEVAFVLTTDQLEEVNHVEILIKPADKQWQRKMDDYVRNMHLSNGLAVQVDLAGVPLVEAAARLRSWLEITGSAGHPLGGSSVHFDRKWLAHDMPTVEALFHYRNIDISTVKELSRRWKPDLEQSAPRGLGAHRALTDLRDTLELARHYRRIWQ